MILSYLSSPMTNNTHTLNKRQDRILDFIDKSGDASTSDIFTAIFKEARVVAEITVKRDLRKLVDLGLIVSKGAGRAVKYELSSAYSIIRPINVDQYFEKEIDERAIRQHFNFNVFSSLKSVFSRDEKIFLQKLNNGYLKKIKKLPKDVLKKEFERLTIELSWKSSRIEGNTYSLLETEQLLKENREASGHTREEAIMILNHKKALDYIRNNVQEFKSVSLRKLEEIHSLLVEGLGVSKNVRKVMVRITGTRFQPLDNEFQITESLKKTCSLINQRKNPFEKALILMLLIAYIQPFVDGNKRTSRLAGNAVLLANNCCPLSYRSINEIEYKKAVLIFYEQNNISYFKKLFLQQFEFVVKNYF